MLSHSGVVWSRMGWNLRRLSRAAVIRDGGVDLRRSRAASRRSANAALAARARRSSALGRLRREVTRSLGPLILLLEGRLLGRRRGRGRRALLKSGRSRLHVCWLFLLLRWRRRRDQGLSSLSCHDRAEMIASHPDSGGRLLSRVLWGWVHVARARSASARLQLATEQSNLILVPVQISSACFHEVLDIR